MSTIEAVTLSIALIDTGCWAGCFWWMHRISTRQNAMLTERHAVTQRIERLSRAEHDMIKDVHPTVGKIKESVEQVAEAVDAKPAS